MNVETLVREFNYNGVRLPDPNVDLSVEEVRNLYATAYPDITTAAIEGPEAVGNKLIYRFSRSIEIRGAFFSRFRFRAFCLRMQPFAVTRQKMDRTHFFVELGIWRARICFQCRISGWAG